MGMKSLFDLMSSESRPFALFGDVCTNVNEPVAMASKYWNILHLSYAETHPKFATSDSKEVPPSFTIVNLLALSDVLSNGARGSQLDSCPLPSVIELQLDESRNYQTER